MWGNRLYLFSFILSLRSEPLDTPQLIFSAPNHGSSGTRRMAGNIRAFNRSGVDSTQGTKIHNLRQQERNMVTIPMGDDTERPFGSITEALYG
jgi:hypothetical protein